MSEIASIVDLRGQQLYYVGTGVVDMFYVKKMLSSRQAAINWATSKKRIKEFGENAKFYITHA